MRKLWFWRIGLDNSCPQWQNNVQSLFRQDKDKRGRRKKIDILFKY